MITQSQQKEKYDKSVVYRRSPDDFGNDLENRYSLRNPFGLYFTRRRVTDFIKILNAEKVVLKDKRILDVGCHFGFYANLLASLKGSAQEVYGVDFQEDFLQVARQINPGIKFIQHNLYQELPFADQSFDFILCNYVFNAFSHEDAKKIASMISRKLKIGGYILVFDPRGKSPLMNLTLRGLARMLEVFKGVKTAKGSAGANSFTSRQWQEMFADCQLKQEKTGLNIGSYRLVQLNCPYWFIEMLDRVLLSAFIYSLFQKK